MVLEKVPKIKSIFDYFETERFGTPKDLSRIIISERLSRELTNVFYSMENSNTEFKPYQFKPVFIFIESINRKILIADEVGLGKTIEALYIWKELKAREGANKLLIICPAMLKEKWKLDIEKYFNENADIVNAKQLLEALETNRKNYQNRPFVLIASIETKMNLKTF